MRSVEAIQLDCRGALCAPANEHAFVITSLAPPGVVIQLDGHGAERLAMTFSGFIAAITPAAALAAGSRNDKSLKQSGRRYSVLSPAQSSPWYASQSER